MKLSLRNLSLQFDGKTRLFQNANLTVESGAFVVIRGSSGSGKSSLLRVLNRLQDATSGEVLVDDRPIGDHDVTRLRRRMGYVQQTPVVIGGTVRDNLHLPFRFKITDGAVFPTDDVLRKMLDAYLLQDVDLDETASELSVGQRQRIALIRALLVEPEILLCDEPTSALDPESKTIVERELERINRENGISVVLVTHVDFEPENIEPQIYTLTSDGLV